MRGFWMFTMLVGLLGVYLFVSAPAPLEELRAQHGKRIAVSELFELVAAENAAVRQLYTQEIVAAGKRAGLRFDENWRDEGVEFEDLDDGGFRVTVRAPVLGRPATPKDRRQRRTRRELGITAVAPHGAGRN